MKTAVKVLCIIALVIGLIWATVGFFGAGIGGGLSAGFALDAETATTRMDNTVMLMLRLIGSFIVVIIAGVLGIVGSDRTPKKLKAIILGAIVFICGIALFPLNNYIAAVLYIIAGLLLFIAGMIIKSNEQVTVEVGEP